MEVSSTLPLSSASTPVTAATIPERSRRNTEHG
jgi:hypothetical protein